MLYEVITGMVAIFTYGFKTAEENFASNEVELTTLSDYQTLIEVAVETGYVSAEDVKALSGWRTDPANWGK